MARRLFATVASNLIVLVVLAEAVGLIFYYAQNGGLFYIHRKAYTPIADTHKDALTPVALHPYFGPTHKPGNPFSMPEALLKARPAAPAATNNFGFVSRHDYPYTRTNPDEFIVGIFGGSVGVWFCQLGADRLLENLRRTASFGDKKLVALCFSHEGYKQPQQALVLAYFLSIGQHLDLVVNIDGFNEVALGRLNDQHGLDISMPSVMHIDPLINLVNQSTLTPEKLASLADITHYKRRLNTLADWINRNRIASVNLALDQWYQIVSRKLVAEQFTFAALPSTRAESSLVYVTPRTRERAGAVLYDDIARNWAASSALMQQLLAARSVPYVHVLQPNQYYTRRRFTDEEARIALNDQSPFREGVQRGYPALLRVAESTAAQEGGFVDATHIFDSEPSPVYLDDCCHFTLRGNEMLADYIASAIVAPAAQRGR